MPELSGTKMVAAIERSTGQNRTTDTVAQRKVDMAIRVAVEAIRRMIKEDQGQVL